MFKIAYVFELCKIIIYIWELFGINYRQIFRTTKKHIFFGFQLIIIGSLNACYHCLYYMKSLSNQHKHARFSARTVKWWFKFIQNRTQASSDVTRCNYFVFNMGKFSASITYRRSFQDHDIVIIQRRRWSIDSQVTEIQLVIERSSLSWFCCL